MEVFLFSDTFNKVVIYLNIACLVVLFKHQATVHSADKSLKDVFPSDSTFTTPTTASTTTSTTTTTPRPITTFVPTPHSKNLDDILLLIQFNYAPENNTLHEILIRQKTVFKHILAAIPQHKGILTDPLNEVAKNMNSETINILPYVGDNGNVSPMTNLVSAMKIVQKENNFRGKGTTRILGILETHDDLFVNLTA